MLTTTTPVTALDAINFNHNTKTLADLEKIPFGPKTAPAYEVRTAHAVIRNESIFGRWSSKEALFQLRDSMFSDVAAEVEAYMLSLVGDGKYDHGVSEQAIVYSLELIVYRSIRAEELLYRSMYRASARSTVPYKMGHWFLGNDLDLRSIEREIRSMIRNSNPAQMERIRLATLCKYIKHVMDLIGMTPDNWHRSNNAYRIAATSIVMNGVKLKVIDAVLRQIDEKQLPEEPPLKLHELPPWKNPVVYRHDAHRQLTMRDIRRAAAAMQAATAA